MTDPKATAMVLTEIRDPVIAAAVIALMQERDALQSDLTTSRQETEQARAEGAVLLEGIKQMAILYMKNANKPDKDQNRQADVSSTVSSQRAEFDRQLAELRGKLMEFSGEFLQVLNGYKLGVNDSALGPID